MQAVSYPRLANWHADGSYSMAHSPRPVKPVVEKTPELEVDPDIAWTGDVSFIIPGDLKIEDLSAVTGKLITLNRQVALCVYGDHAALDGLAGGSIVTGHLTIRRKKGNPLLVESMILIVGSCAAPRFKLEFGHGHLPGAVWSKRLVGCSVSVMPVSQGKGRRKTI